MFHPGRAYERFCDRVWMGFCIWMMLRAPKLYAWLSKDVSLLSKEQEARVVDLNLHVRLRLFRRHAGRASDRRADRQLLPGRWTGEIGRAHV